MKHQIILLSLLLTSCISDIKLHTDNSQSSRGADDFNLFAEKRSATITFNDGRKITAVSPQIMRHLLIWKDKETKETVSRPLADIRSVLFISRANGAGVGGGVGALTGLIWGYAGSEGGEMMSEGSAKTIGAVLGCGVGALIGLAVGTGVGFRYTYTFE